MTDNSDAWMITGHYEDLDESFDEAVTEAADSHGVEHPLLAANTDTLDFNYRDSLIGNGGSGARTLTGAQRQAGIIVGGETLDNGSVIAIPYSADRFWTRRRVNVKIENNDTELGVEGLITEPVELPYRKGLVEELCNLACDTISDNEHVDSVAVLRLRCRYRTTAVKGEGKAQRVFVARTADGTIIGTGRTATEARRAASDVMKGVFAGKERYSVEVYAEVRRETGPHILLTRNRIAQRGAVRLAVSSEKDPTKTKTAGWVFAGRGRQP